ncbi:MAG TPA: alpha/beta hydrolase [Gammaproteobacteria bacterium]|nr:alpha/beta hydrolase [Gammaproteobacteria bacterium]
MPFPFKCLGVSLALTLCACGSPARPDGPIPVQQFPAHQSAATHPLVIVLPGRGDDLGDLATSGIVQAIQRAWPQADVLLAGATLGYYTDGNVAQHLREDVIAPAHRRGYREIWLCGASMGGMGALLYDERYPRDVTGLVLLAPYMGDPDLIAQVAAEGGPARWDPGPVPARVDRNNYQHELWRGVKDWRDPAQAGRIWLSGGTADRFVRSTRMLASLLPQGHYVKEDGGHAWPVWDAGAAEIFTMIAAAHVC